jgi:hypothetical protein
LISLFAPGILVPASGKNDSYAYIASIDLVDLDYQKTYVKSFMTGGVVNQLEI